MGAHDIERRAVADRDGIEQTVASAAVGGHGGGEDGDAGLVGDGTGGRQFQRQRGQRERGWRPRHRRREGLGLGAARSRSATDFQ